MIRLVVTDMDGTLYSWIDYIVPAVETMVEVVCRATGFTRIKVVQALKAVYERYESNEYPFALQESSLYAELNEFGSFDKLIIEPARLAFREARRKYLRPYRRVKETLEALKDRGIPVVALTDAPRNPAEARVKHLEIDALLGALYTMPGFEFPAGRDGATLVAREILAKEGRGEYRAACKVVELQRELEKPNPEGLRRICADFGVEPHEVLVVGDSLKKDVAVARAVGAIDCWAEYGTYVSAEHRERLDIVSGTSITLRHAASLYEVHDEAAPATHALSNFGQVLEIIDARAGRRA